MVESTPATTALQPFLDAFEAWVAAQRRQHRVDQPLSIQAYRVLWMSLARWAVGQRPPLGLDTLTPHDLDRFVHRRVHGDGGAAPSPRHVWRLLTLVDRVLCHRGAGSGLPPNRAACTLLASRDDWVHANAAHKDPLPEHLSAAQARALVRHLSQAIPRGRRGGSDGPWQALRSSTAVALHLGAGVTPAEVRALRVDSVVAAGGPAAGLPWKLLVPAIGDQPARETPLAAWAARLLRHWLDTRQALQIPGLQLLPSTRTGKPWSKVSHYLAVKEVILAAGLGDEAAAGGSFRLRHTFALRQLRRGRSPEDVARWLGVEPVEVDRYRRVVFTPLPDLD